VEETAQAGSNASALGGPVEIPPDLRSIAFGSQPNMRAQVPPPDPKRQKAPIAQLTPGTRQIRTFSWPVAMHNHASSRAIGVGAAVLIVGPGLR
jgi:hypothetical protein